MKVKIHLLLHYENENIDEYCEGIYKEQEKELFFLDSLKNSMHFYFQNHLLVRDTKESIFSYHFEREGTLEIYLKEYQKGTRILLTTKLNQYEEGKVHLEYQIEGNDFFHTLKLEWEMIK